MSEQPNVAILNPNDILTPEELAKRLKVRPTWIYEKMRSRSGPRLPHFRCGRYLRFNWPDVCAWLQSTAPKQKRAA